MPHITITSPAYNEAKSLPLLCQAIQKSMENTGVDYEILIVDNQSEDNSQEVLEELKKTYPQLKYAVLSKNFGHQGGMLAGMELASGEAVVTMDADLQHPPEILPEMIKAWKAGHLIVNTAKRSSTASPLRALFNHSFYRLMQKLIGIQIGQADFRLLDRKVLDILNQLPEKEKFIRGLASWIGFKMTTVPYDVGKRLHGHSKFRYRHLVDFAFQGITSFSTFPLKIVTQMGILLFIPSLLYLIFLAIRTFLAVLYPHAYSLPPGFATLAVTIILFGAIQLLSIGILGEYIGRIYAEVKQRPNFIVEKDPS